MCRSKAENGARCAGHVRAEHTKWKQRKEQQEMKLAQIIKDRDEGKPIRKQTVDRARAALAKSNSKVEQAEAELADIELRKEKNVRGRGQSLNKFLGGCLKPEEWDALRAEATQKETTVSELVRERLNGYPAIKPVLAGDRPWQRWNDGATGGRRIPTQGGGNNYQRENQGVRVSETKLAQLEREAGLFGLTRSDYVRSLVMGVDPRTFGHHISTGYAENQIAHIKRVENINNVTPATAQEYWTEAIRKERYEPQAA